MYSTTYILSIYIYFFSYQISFQNLLPFFWGGVLNSPKGLMTFSKKV